MTTGHRRGRNAAVDVDKGKAAKTISQEQPCRDVMHKQARVLHLTERQPGNADSDSLGLVGVAPYM